MRGRIYVAVAAASMLLIPTAANAAPPHDEFTGSGSIAGAVEFRANVRSDADGTNPRGHFSRDYDEAIMENLDFQGKPTCMVIEGNAVVVGGYQKDHPSGYDQFFVYLEDNGPSGDRSLHPVSIGDVAPDQQKCSEIMDWMRSLHPAQFHTVDGDFTIVDR